MAKPSKKYWEGRSAQRELESQVIADKYLAQMDVKLRESQREILKEIESFYGRYAVDNKISIQDAKRYLTAKEMKDFKNVDLKRFREMSLDGNPEYDKLLNSISYRSRISRLEAVNAHIEITMMELYGGKNGLQEYANTGLAEIYQNSYHKSLYEIAKGGKDISIVGLTDDRMKEVLSYNWSGKEFSDRIWDHQSGALQTIRKEMERSFVSGRSIQQTSKSIMDATDVTRSRVEALVRTEASFFNNQASKDSYDDAEIDEYEILSTLDLRTSEICREQDGKRYKTKDFKPGTNAPPFHVRCRSTTIPWFDESEYTDGEQRQSMDGMVDSQTYEEWYGKNVTGSESNENKEKMIQNRLGDIEQMKKYQTAKVEGAPKSLVAFQNLKYNDEEKYEQLMKAYRKRKK
ncbi:minor capsid protein [Sporosarcina sp. resist]|uniref:minor capsid protein n=1 Tax=Sporosarcina sp. resist TaxID=2762563 RepID=UPI00164E4202|nr:minor capsid protein [Sporosarcina sp. resist]QNK89428.1 minor capsid protein [Sporosarcina sp. resist]